MEDSVGYRSAKDLEDYNLFHANFEMDERTRYPKSKWKIAPPAKIMPSKMALIYKYSHLSTSLA